MKICMVSGTFPNMHCGVGDYTYWLSKAISANDIKIDLITTDSNKVANRDWLTIHRTIADWGWLHMKNLLRTVKDTACDIVHLQYPTQAYKHKAMINFFPIVLRATGIKVPFVVTLHDVSTAHVLNKIRLFPLLACTDHAVVSAAEEKNYLIKRLFFKEKKSAVIPLGSNIQRFPSTDEDRREIRTRLGLKDGEILIVHFGYILKKKHIETLFPALCELKKKEYRFKVMMLSDFNPDRDPYHLYLKNVVSSLGLDDELRWIGYLKPEEVSRYLSASDIALQVYQDGVSLHRGSLLADLLHGLPTVVPTHDILLERFGGLVNGDNILFYSLENQDALVHCLENLIKSPESRMAIGEKAKKFAERFSWNYIAEKHISLYNYLLSEGRG